MVDSGGDDDSIFFNKDIHPKIITITKDRVIENKKTENVIILNKGRNKILMNIENKKTKINKEEIMNSLNKIKKIQIENFDDNEYKNRNNKNNIYPSGYNKTTQNILKITVNNGKVIDNDIYIDNQINKNIYDKTINPVKINKMKNILLKKEKEEMLEEGKKTSTFNIYDKNIFSKIDNDYNGHDNIIRQSDRFSLKNSSNDDNLNSNSDFFYNNNNYNYSDDRKQETNGNIEKKMNFYINKKELTRNSTLNIDRRNSTSLITSIVNILHSTKSQLTDNSQKSSPYDKCLICERTFSIINLCCSQCNIHFFCRKCLNNYCRGLIEKGIKRMKCPITKCNFDIYQEFLKSILSEDYFSLLCKNSKSIKSEEKSISSVNISGNKYEIFNKKIKHNLKDKKMRLYSNKHVIDVNSNIMFYNIRKYKDEYCSKCGEPSLFCKTTTFFHKCLNCGFKICKYCNKEYSPTHLILDYPNHCKIYFRRADDISFKNNYLFNYLIQLIYVAAMFYIAFAFSFLFIFRVFKTIFKIEKKHNNMIFFILYAIKYFFCMFVSILLFIIIFPFIFIWTPYFPSIIALFDGF